MKLEVRLDPGTKVLGRTLLGGAPLRVLRLSEPGARIVREWRHGAVVTTPQQRKLADRLIDAGMAHPLYGETHLTRADVTVVVPARDPEALPPGADVVVDDGSRTPISVAAERHPVARGPAAARNTGLRHVRTELTAFLDADTVPQPGWLDSLLPHFEDPQVVAVGPRVRSAPGSSVVERYEQARSSLDLGDGPGPVRPGARVTYLPTAALVVRTAAVREIGGFDERLRFGEDVDLVWRLVAQGGRVRFEPASEVVHQPRKTWRAWAKQRFDYGTSAAPLAKRHGHKAIAPLKISGWTALAWALAAVRKPGLGAAVALGTAALLPRKLRPVGVPPREALTLALRGHLGAGRYLADVLTRTWGPVAMPLLAATPRGRIVLALALARHLTEWRRLRPDLDPVRWLLARTADDFAYGAGVWRGCARERTALPLVPDLSNWPGRK
ncbi:mycofactocin system glycosyltransferase [Amycolatopsis bartoniae]|uniref:Putative glycosyltransferase n=1 Tax=Amycolatopsis bartoniae TaxID=941986 RepID=A0A8H9MDV3_9PSEU|nr:mycofactocin biosynthesis glycosyltransferase MftF [Amycolatopsis bartoniae]MBB2937572.1 mycofactocin system glycosyltransferase [Amycolatopsis bartoniae]TVT05917.1 mycofactocin system glycosyltransferase [Amycolatopsis bartoniae]GHF82263.1 putative glycosyltransferase [Amycolatopsis bartoniae]